MVLCNDTSAFVFPTWGKSLLNLADVDRRLSFGAN